VELGFRCAVEKCLNFRLCDIHNIEGPMPPNISKSQGPGVITLTLVVYPALQLRDSEIYYYVDMLIAHQSLYYIIIFIHTKNLKQLYIFN
jgi:hypothetical protein